MFRTRAVLLALGGVVSMGAACGLSPTGNEGPSDAGSGSPGTSNVDGALSPDVTMGLPGSEGSSMGGGGSGGGGSPPTGGGSADSSSPDGVASTDSGFTRKDGAGSDGASKEPDAAAASFFLGADVSFVQQEEAQGRVFYDVDGTAGDIFQILKNHGFTYIRLRTFVDPTASDGYDTGNGTTTAFCDAAHTVTMGARVKAAGMGLILDFHMSDTWADPGHQATPLAWQGDTFAELTTQVQTYTNTVIAQMVAGNARPDIVEVGNEITPGMLFPLGEISSGGWTNLGTLLKAGIAGVKAVDSTIKIMMHIDRGGDNAGTIYWVNNAMAQSVPFDILGESCYTNFQGDPSTWKANLDSLPAMYPNLSFMIAEYAEDSADLAGNSECTAEGAGPCNAWRTANDIAFGIPNKKGIGTLIWEPTEYEETLFDNQNRALTNDPTGLPNPFGTGARIQLYDQMVTAYGL
jgi:arabinogalactan endo-1,4-beta-galactosidase